MELQLLLGAAALAGGAALTWSTVSTERATARASAVNLQRGLATRTGVALPARGSSWSPMLERLAGATRRFTPTARLEALDRRLLVAGLASRWTAERLLTVKVGLTLVGGLLGLIWLAGSPSPMTVLLAVVVTAGGWHVPELLVRNAADKRRAQLVRELPDLVDRLCVLVESGLVFDRALARATKGSGGVLATELARTVQEVELGARRIDALQALADRTDVAEVRRIVASLRHAEQYGVPVAQVLRTEAEALRDRANQLAEERAQKLPVQVLFPLVLCILPALLVVVLGPALVDLLGGLGE